MRPQWNPNLVIDRLVGPPGAGFEVLVERRPWKGWLARRKLACDMTGSTMATLSGAES